MHHGATALGHIGHHVAYRHYASGGTWFMHSVINGVIHAAIFHMIAPLFRGQGILGSLLIGVALIGLAFAAWQMYRNITRRSFWRRPF